MNFLTEKAYAKINLGLDVIRKRPDGYHEVRMVMQTLGLCDELSVERTDEPGAVISTDNDNIPAGEDNLIHKAYRLMAETYGLAGGIKVYLKKKIPVAAGLAGGSSDAAATMRAVNVLFDLKLTDDRLKELGVRIGADVPYCITGGTALSEGIGEILTPLKDCPKCSVLLAKPPVDVSTAHVYGNLRLEQVSHPDIDAITDGIRSGDIEKIAANLGNVLESVTVSENPVIDDIKQLMSDSGAIPGGVLMSGSGPTVFGLFDSEERCKEAHDRILGSGMAKEVFCTYMTGL